MARARATINAGICGFVTHVTAVSEDGRNVTLKVDSTCQNVTALGERLPELDAYAEVGAGFDGELWRAIRANLKGCCSGCVVPAGLFKGMQVAAGVALPQTVGIELELER